MLPTPYVKCDYEKVYEPSEDTFLLLDALEEDQSYLAEKFEDKLALVCELGPGTGTVITFMMQNNIPNKGKSIYLALDINPWAVETTLDTAERNGCGKCVLEPVQSNLNTSLRRNEVDILVFNPPYVPAEKVPDVPDNKDQIHQWLDLALEGGKDGMVVTQEVLDQLDNILSTDGVAYILFCAQNKPVEVTKIMAEKYSWKIDLVLHRKAGWEVLSVYRFSRT